MRSQHIRTRPNQLDSYRQEIIQLHSQGLSPSEIGDILEKERTTIIYHLRILGLRPVSKPMEKRICVPERIEKGLINKLNKKIDIKYPAEKENRGKLSYQEYMDETNSRKKRVL